MNNVFVSEGLDIDFGDQIQVGQIINVSFGDLKGVLHSVRLGQNQRLEFLTPNVEGALKLDTTNVTKFRLEFNKKIYDFSLEPYNYTLTPFGDGIVVTIEEYAT